VQTFQHHGYTLAGKRDVDFDGQALAAPLVEHIEGTKPPAADQTIVNEINRPGLNWPRTTDDSRPSNCRPTRRNSIRWNTFGATGSSTNYPTSASAISVSSAIRRAAQIPCGA
jgi:hypothetical protein